MFFSLKLGFYVGRMPFLSEENRKDKFISNLLPTDLFNQIWLYFCLVKIPSLKDMLIHTVQQCDYN